VSDPFVHLHVHTSYSMLDGAARLRDLVQAAVRDGQPGLAITDHGNLYGLLEFYDLCTQAGIVPILGLEAYQAEESRLERTRTTTRVEEQGLDVSSTSSNKSFYHLSLLAETTEGYRNLIQLSSEAFLSGYHYKPRVDWELLERHQAGLIATTGCLGGLVLQALLADNYELARQRAGRLREIFGPDRLFVELQDHGLPDQQRTNPQLVRLARDLGVGLVATNDSHYVEPGDALTHDVLLCVQTKAHRDDPKRFRFSSDQHWLKTAAQMRQLFGELPESLANTLLIAERCRGVNPYPSDQPGGVPTPQLPGLPPPPEFASEPDPWGAWLRDLVQRGAYQRYGRPVPQPVQQRLDWELQVIDQMGFNKYFLIVWDMVRFARQEGIRVGPGRGSAAGSVVGYCLDIHRLDPLRYGLLFERFLNPGRRTMPDIDVDFEQERRPEVVQYLSRRWGEQCVASIVTFSVIQSRAAIRDTCRVLGHDWSYGDSLARLLPPLILGRETPLRACLQRHPDYAQGYEMAQQLRERNEQDPQARQVLEVAQGLEGLHRTDGIHAGAVVLADRPLTQYLPVQQKPDGKRSGALVSQYDMHGVERLGLLKMDLLGLRTLSAIGHACQLIGQTDGIHIEPDELPLDDERTYELLRSGDGAGIFQLEQPGIQQLLRAMAPTDFNDIGALLALYRPGPMAAGMHVEYVERKHGRRQVQYLHPEMQQLLGDTYGLMIYQESIMRVAQHFAGLSLAEADDLRRACGKRSRETMAKYRQRLIAGCRERGYGEQLGQQLWDIIEPFADYAFNKSHSFSYGIITYQTAWLKANWPHHYMAAVLSSYMDDTDRLETFLGVTQAMGLRLRCPDVQCSEYAFSVRREDDGGYAIQMGLGAVRGVGRHHAEVIVQARQAGGPFRDLWDLLQRIPDPQIHNAAALQALAQAGAFDSFGPRRALYLHIPRLLETARQLQKVAPQREFWLLDPTQLLQPPPMHEPKQEWPPMDRLLREYAVLNGFISGHPLAQQRGAIRAMRCNTVQQIRQMESGSACTVVGLVTQLSPQLTKKGQRMAKLRLLCLDGVLQALVMPRVLQHCEQQLANRALVRLAGTWRAEGDGEGVVFVSQAQQLPGEPPAGQSEPLVIQVPRQLSVEDLAQLRRLLEAHPGLSPVLVQADDRILRLPPRFGVHITPQLVAKIRLWRQRRLVELGWDTSREAS